ncbi:MAG: aldehyde dehydrogenase family protein [Sphingobacteriales bacterium 50-39]|nr:aldehyde dehydrogenase family protein [Sphingobacteriales bacterium]OJW53052.1 MAG: aldehyde dehydrogenase family protein [Sphingobacteriales bacterium 50-39]
MNHLVSTIPELPAMRRYFESGVTRSYAFRRQQLISLRRALMNNEDAIYKALYADLRKGPEEAYATETGIVLTEIRVALKNLRRWMRPSAARTNLLNFPSSGRIYHDPLGLVLIIAPWNYPIQLLLTPLVGAIAGGNGVVLKPSEMAPATASILGRIIQEAFPPEYITLVQGDGAEVVPALLNGFHFDHVFYTGSTEVGKQIYQLAAKDLVPVTLELGGKSPAVIHLDANLEVAARRIVMGKFINAGQTCVAPDYLLVHHAIRDRFLELLQKTINQFFGDKPAGNDGYGRIVHAKRFDRLLSYLSEGEIIIGGDYDRADLFMAPTVMDNVPLDSGLMTEEIFGPILPVYGFDTVEEAVELIKRNPNPLAFYVFTEGDPKAWVEQLAFGGGCVNNTLWHLANHYLPFGGIGGSGIGAYHGRYSFETFTHAKPVMRSPVWFDPGIKYPPFAGKLKWFKRMIR